MDFEQEKWLAEVDARRREFELKEREFALKEREQANRDADIELKRQDQAASKWRSPIVVAILAAAVAATGNAVIAVVNGSLQRDLESRKRDAEINLENSKAESTRILEMIKTGETEKAAGNLEFLLKAGLVTDSVRVAKLTEFLKSRAPGGGPSLPAPESRIGFEATESLTESLQGNLQKLLEEYIAYLDKVGFPATTQKVKIKVDKLQTPNAYYSNGVIVIDTKLSADPSVALREYGHHILTGTEKSQPWERQYGAIESGLADYFACSFLNNPKMGEKAIKAFDPSRPYIRLLANDRKFAEFRTVGEDQMNYVGAEIWGGAFWAIRAKLGREAADPIIAAAWLAMRWPPEESGRAPGFVEALLSAARAKGSAQLDTTRAVLRAREFPLRG